MDLLLFLFNNNQFKKNDFIYLNQNYQRLNMTTENDIKNIKKYIAKFKNYTDLNQPYLEFNLNWLKSFKQELVIDVLNEFDNLRDERIYSYCELSMGVLRNFITSLEIILMKTQ